MDGTVERSEFARLRDACPVSRIGPGAHLVVRYADIVSVLRDEVAYDQVADESVPHAARDLWAHDPAEHHRRRLRLFSSDRIDALAPTAAATARRLLVAAAGKERGDLSDELIAPLTRDVIAELVGIPEPARDAVFGWVQRMGSAMAAPEADRAASWEAGASPLRAWVTAERERRRGTNGARPDADGLDLLLRADLQRGRTVTDEELLGYVYLLCRSGTGPLARLLGNVLHRLALEPHELDAIHNDPTRAVAVVESVLRDDPPIQYLMRLPAESVVIHGEQIGPGERLVMSVASANHDAALSTSGSPRHVAFGRGEHFCPAASFGRVVAARLAVELADLVTEIRFHPDADLASLHAPSVWAPVALPAMLVRRRFP